MSDVSKPCESGDGIPVERGMSSNEIPVEHCMSSNEIQVEQCKSSSEFEVHNSHDDAVQQSFEATVVGSSNYGARSFERDLESQLLILTCDKGLCERIRKDREDIFQYARATRRSDMESCQKTTSRYTRIVAHLTQSYL